MRGREESSTGADKISEAIAAAVQMQNSAEGTGAQGRISLVGWVSEA